MTVVEKYVNPFTDYGFKRLFGEEPNKNLLMNFLNKLLREEQGDDWNFKLDPIYTIAILDLSLMTTKTKPINIAMKAV